VRDGRLQLVGRMWKGSEKNGLFELWLADGTLVERTNRKDGLRNGTQERWWPNGAMRSKAEYKDEVAVGDFVNYDEGGVPTFISHLDENGRNDAPTRQYWRRQLSEYTEYAPGGMRRDGWRFYEDGTLSAYYGYDKDGTSVDRRVIRDENGHVRDVELLDGKKEQAVELLTAAAKIAKERSEAQKGQSPLYK